MTNKIDGSGSRPVQTGTGRAVHGPGSRPAAEVAGPGTTPGSRVTITGPARSLVALERALADTPDVNAARVAELRAAIESGRYKVDPHRIADRLVEFARELAAAGGRAG